MTAGRSAVAAAPSWPRLLTELLAGRSLTAGSTGWAMDEIMTGSATAAQIAAFAVLLRAKGETAAELSGLVRTMLDQAVPIDVPGRSVDVVGTGGDQAHTVNITTMAALVVAASGRQVVKHGNRSASSLCGSADVLEHLGVAIDLPATGVAATVAQTGIGFCFAPVFHPGMRFAGPARREVGVPTAFNILGPLTNPARPAAGAIGCADARLAPVMAAVFAARGDDVLLFRGEDGLDEITVTAPSTVWRVTGGSVTEETVDPRELGLPFAAPPELAGGDPAFNAAVVHQVLAGRAGPVRDAVLLNAAAAIAAFDGTMDSTDAALRHGLPIAAAAIDSQAGAALLANWVQSSQAERGRLAL